MPYADRGGEGGDRQRREKDLPILTAEKSEHERAYAATTMLCVNCVSSFIARDIASPAVKRGNKGHTRVP